MDNPTAPTSAEINRAIEILRVAGIGAYTMQTLDQWNARRLKAAAQQVTGREDAAALFEGIAPDTLARAGIT